MPYRPRISPNFGDSLIDALEKDGCFADCGTSVLWIIRVGVVLGVLFVLTGFILPWVWGIIGGTLDNYWIATVALPVVVLVLLFRRRR